MTSGNVLYHDKMYSFEYKKYPLTYSGIILNKERTHFTILISEDELTMSEYYPHGVFNIDFMKHLFEEIKRIEMSISKKITR